MPELNRRRFLGSLAAATVAGVGAARLIVDPQPRTFAQAPPGCGGDLRSDAPAGGLVAAPAAERSHPAARRWAH